jgi:imidazolonepropionase-like amidohydrolase
LKNIWKYAKRILLAVVALAAILAAAFVVELRLAQHRVMILRDRPVDFYARERGAIALDHVMLIDGTGHQAEPDQTVILEKGSITYVGPFAGRPNRPNIKSLDLSGHSVVPGLVGMHEHLFTTAATLPGSHTQLVQQSTVSRLLYLAAGVTTARTAGSIEPEADLQLKRRIDRGELIGPSLYLTAPYLEGNPPTFAEMHGLANAEEARAIVNRWAERGMTSFKAYMNITPSELRAAIDTAHQRGIKITGHLCSIGLEEASQMGIDNLEHGLVTATEFYSGKQSDHCPERVGPVLRELNGMNIQGEQIQHLISILIDRHVAITSTLAVLESELSNPSSDNEERRRHAMTWMAWKLSQMRRNHIAGFHMGSLLNQEMAFERAFVQAGGMLLAGCDPTGDGSVLPGLGDQRELELLVAAGFTTVEAIQIATWNGARFLGIADQAGTVEAGKDADLVVLAGDITQQISNIEHVELVFKKGVAYDSGAIFADVHGIVGLGEP